ncbi:MAG: transport system ATP-binding/permease protein, partial [Frankiales bacterium]|nr:transport system ATP-binding/permease protein [Frankiales bacterium]
MGPLDSAVIGRDADCEITVSHPQVSRRHLQVEATGRGQWQARDLQSRNGTFSVDGPVDTVQINGELTRLLLGDRASGLIVELEPRTAATAPSAASRGGTGSTAVMSQIGRLTAVHHLTAELVIGRAPDCDLALDDLQVSRKHARLLVGDGSARVEDLGSHNGTFVNGSRVNSAALRDYDLLNIGGHLLEFVDGSLREYDDHGAAWLLAQDVSVTIDGRRVLDGVSFPLAPNSLLAVVGPSGAGKSTLLNALTGFRSPSSGAVVYGGRDVYQSRVELQSKMAYVPQDDVLHPQLRVRRALEYAARLRFPPDVDRPAREKRVEEVLEELSLTERADLPISKLSGGQRKRVSVALELLTKPSLLFLDEPTSGLDPGNEEQVMRLLRDLADGDRTVVVVTHSLQSLDLCDRVLFLAPGGVTAFFGEPRGVLTYFADDGQTVR